MKSIIDKNMKHLLSNSWKLILIGLIVSVPAFAQKSFTLKECIKYASTQNSNNKVAE